MKGTDREILLSEEALIPDNALYEESNILNFKEYIIYTVFINFIHKVFPDKADGRYLIYSGKIEQKIAPFNMINLIYLTNINVNQ